MPCFVSEFERLQLMSTWITWYVLIAKISGSTVMKIQMWPYSKLFLSNNYSIYLLWFVLISWRCGYVLHWRDAIRRELKQYLKTPFILEKTWTLALTAHKNTTIQFRSNCGDHNGAPIGSLVLVLLSRYHCLTAIRFSCKRSYKMFEPFYQEFRKININCIFFVSIFPPKCIAYFPLLQSTIVSSLDTRPSFVCLFFIYFLFFHSFVFYIKSHFLL